MLQYLTISVAQCGRVTGAQSGDAFLSLVCGRISLAQNLCAAIGTEPCSSRFGLLLLLLLHVMQTLEKQLAGQQST